MCQYSICLIYFIVFSNLFRLHNITHHKVYSHGQMYTQISYTLLVKFLDIYIGPEAKNSHCRGPYMVMSVIIQQLICLKQFVQLLSCIEESEVTEMVSLYISFQFPIRNLILWNDIPCFIFVLWHMQSIFCLVSFPIRQNFIKFEVNVL